MELAKLQVELTRLQTLVQATGAHIIVAFEGRDTAGKGGVISRIVDPLERLEACEFEARSEYLVLALDRPFDPERARPARARSGTLLGRQDTGISRIPIATLTETSKQMPPRSFQQKEPGRRADRHGLGRRARADRGTVA
jgi:Polyphosphate kinase 2 (PPK2)